MALAIFEESVQENEQKQVTEVQGFIGPEAGKYVPHVQDGKKTGVSTMEYTRYATFKMKFEGGRVTYWRVSLRGNGSYGVYESTENGRAIMELEGDFASGLVKLGQIVNALMSLAAEYSTTALEKQPSK